MSVCENSVSRRGFVAGAGAAAVLWVAGTSQVLAAEAQDFDDTYDVVVLGDGFAGATAAIYAAEAGARVLLVDAAPEGHHGGNSRYCGQVVVTGHDREQLLAYYRALGGEFEQDEELLEAYVDGLLESPSIMAQIGASNPVLWSEWVKIAPDDDIAKKSFPSLAPEFSGLPGCETIDVCTQDAKFFNGALYEVCQEKIATIDAITLWLESPAKHLIQNVATKEVVGAVIEHEGAELRIGATGGVVIATGGFECNQRMIQDYLGLPRLAPIGGLYNFGDGIRMAQEAGADLWHMHNYESLGILGGNAFAVDDGERALYVNDKKFFAAAKGAFFLASDDGSRFMPEDAAGKHGHIYSHGVWRIPNTSHHPYAIFDQAQRDHVEEAGMLPDNAIDKALIADTPEELAELMGVDPQIFATTFANFNAYAADGFDPEFGRAGDTMRPFEGTLYAYPMQPSVLNTQGGPRRNAQARVLDPYGNPIPGLFSAGECGGCNTFYYQGGGNVGECLVFGRIAGTNAAAGLR